MKQSERIDYLIDNLIGSSNDKMRKALENHNKSDVLHSLMNIWMPKPIDTEVLRVQDEYLQEELSKKGVVTLDDISSIKDEFESSHPFADKISIWQGDITRLEIGAIVNAANSRMLGCLAPLHKCIDNAIHTASGLQLRIECNDYMQSQKFEDENYEEPTGQAVITDAYNLPSDYVIHTVGPIVSHKLTDGLREDLANSYKNSLKIAVENNVRSIAFCCISTGVFLFPNEDASKIAIDTVDKFLTEYPDSFDRVVFNVFKDLDRNIYRELLK